MGLGLSMWLYNEEEIRYGGPSENRRYLKILKASLQVCLRSTKYLVPLKTFNSNAFDTCTLLAVLHLQPERGHGFKPQGHLKSVMHETFKG